ncbi:hypothetical protein Tco_0853477, partial [Tanacetum coccineum]
SGVGVDTAYPMYWIWRIGVSWSRDHARIRRIFLDGYGVLVVRIVIFKISSFKLQNARLLLIFTKYSYYIKVHISQLVPLSLNKVVSFEVVCRDLNIIPTVTLFCVFQCLFKQEDWFSFSKHRRAIPDYLTWRHSCSCVSDDLPTDGYDLNDVERLCARLIRLREMKEEVLIRSGLSSVWFNKKCDLVFRRINDNAGAENLIIYPSPLLERVPSHTTAPATIGAIISLPTPDEIAASLPDPHLAKKSNGPSQVRAEGVDEVDLTDFCTEIKNSLVRDGGTFAHATWPDIASW